MTEWATALVDVAAAGERSVLVTIVAVEGSTPRDAAARMVVTPAGLHGTIGGGRLELLAIEGARRLLADDAAPATVLRVPLGPSAGQCCGGVVTLVLEHVLPDAVAHGWAAAVRDVGEPVVLATGPGGTTVVGWGARDGRTDPHVAVRARALLRGGARAPEVAPGPTLLEPLAPPDLDVVVFGAGHVGRALVAILGALPCRVVWVDERDGQHPPTTAANVRIVTTATPEDEVAAAPPGSCFVVMTHSHGLDLELAARILGRVDFAYFGLIGSRTKRARFAARLQARGIPADAITRMRCPIGLPGVGGKHPGEIAVATAAELLGMRRQRAALTSRLSRTAPRAVPPAPLPSARGASSRRRREVPRR